MITQKLLERLNDSLKKETGEFITVNRVLLSEVYRELMVRIEAEIKPVAVLDIQRNREDKPRLLMEYASALELPDDTYQLFTAPPEPALLGERHPVGGDQWGWDGEYNRGWNAYRSAMLQLSGNSEHVSQGYTLNSPVIPDGWKLVPNEPTTKQWAAGYKAMEGGIDKVTLAYRAMVEVAPSPGGPDDSHATAT